MTDFVIDLYMTYIQINEQVTLQNQDPVNQKAGLKPSLIDLEAYGYKSYGDKGEGFFKEVHAERLNEKDSGYRVCESLISIRKIEREIRRGFPA